MVLPMRRVVSNLVFATFTIAIGCIIGWSFSLGRAPPIRPSDSSVSDRKGFHEFIDRNHMNETLKSFTQETINPGDESITSRFVFNITKDWKDTCDQVVINFYRVMISTPISTTIRDQGGSIVVDRTDQDPYIAWSSDSNLTGSVVSKIIPIEAGRICYGKTGEKSVTELALEAESANCTGLFVVPDLSIFKDLDQNDAQYGSAHYVKGDISTDAVIPSNNVNNVRKTVEELKEEGKIPKIPIVPLSNADFDKLSGKTVTIDVKMNTDLAEIQAPACFFFGSTVQENFIIVDSQMDAFAEGVKDAKSGLVIQNELIKAIYEMKMTGWSNKRTIVFQTWPTSLLGLIGSVEYHQEYRSTIEQLSNAYLSLDQAVLGKDICLSRGSPLFNTIATRLADEVDWDDCPISQGEDCTLLKNWEERYARLDRSAFPKFEPVNVGGNFEPFFQSSGVPTLAFHCFDDGWNPNYPHYHPSGFSKKDSMENFFTMDPKLDVLARLAKYVLSVIEVLAGHTIVNYDVYSYCERIYQETIILNDQYSQLTKMNRNTQLPSIQGILSASQDLLQKAREYQDLVLLVTSNEDFTEQDTTIRYINSLERLFERNLIEPKSGVDGEHVIYGSKSRYTRLYGIYQLEGFGQLLRLFEQIETYKSQSLEIPEDLIYTLQNEFDIVQYHLDQAHTILVSFLRIMVNYN
ncbi:Oidioi.mRNA.OKI2018_I69.chr1.g2748.t1.cds [Oikopleura dioica]|uniref:Oidioi.mRNA.OKI2018_I69.chr1.g2748.t1.cds n=1 Tax=Oikopleura dioica TaxID=34765 RepID=A0ABN7T176_OIKDI|nr:Oidioi.mRNA.OKI2018_I69.chr1.g2748.t1.cds [Oikopleura dioica]